jgi:hypothetical protein
LNEYISRGSSDQYFGFQMLLQGIRIAPKGLAADVADSREAFAIFVILVRHVILRFAVDSNLIDFGLGRVDILARANYTARVAILFRHLGLVN